MNYAWQAGLFVEPDQPMPDLGLRPYQQAARDGILRVHEVTRGALVVLPTGTGKTRLAGAACWDVKRRGGRVLVTCPTIVLCQQMYASLRALGLRCEIEQADNKVRWPLPDVVVASVATMRGPRLKRFDPTTFELVVADEAHRSVSEQQRAIFEHFATAKRLGLTATPDRVDGVSLRNVFDEVAFEMSMLSAIEAGWLVPLRFKTAITNFDPKQLRQLAGDVSADSVEKELVRSGLLHEAANTLAELAGSERTVSFLPTVASSKAFVGELIARGVAAEHVDGTTPTDVRDEIFARFKAGESRVLSNVAVLTEGWDLPACSVCALLTPTKSRSRVTQMIGRITRPSDGKTHGLVIDFCPGRLRKGRLASPADALAGKMLDDAVHEQLAKEGDLAKAIADAEQTVATLEEKKRRKAEKARAKAERDIELAALAKRKAFSYGVQDHDAADVLGGNGRGTSTYVAGDVDGPGEEEWRQQRGLCSTKQAKILAKNGLNPWMKRHLAREAMDAIAANGWRAPDAIKADPRFHTKKSLTEAEMSQHASTLLEELRSR